MKTYRDIRSAWEALKCECQRGYGQFVQRGSFENCEHTFRAQREPTVLTVQDPTDFTFLPVTVTVGMIERYYLEYVIDPRHPEGEDYSYGERIDLSLQFVLDMLRKTPRTNQAIIAVYDAGDILLRYPPCLLFIQFLFYGGKLHLISSWRSNDISEAFLLNQGAMALLLRDAAEYTELSAGSLVYNSSAPHIYLQAQDD